MRITWYHQRIRQCLNTSVIILHPVVELVTFEQFILLVERILFRILQLLKFVRDFYRNESVEVNICDTDMLQLAWQIRNL